MNENYQVDAVETTEIDDVTTSEYSDLFSEEWDSDGLTETAEATEVEMADTGSESSVGDQHEEETAANDNAGKAPEPEVSENAKAETGDQRFSLKAFDDTKELDLSKPEDRDEAISLMQKGMGFDQKVNTLTRKIAEYEEFLKELAEPFGFDIDQVMDMTRAKALRIKETNAGREISETDALLRVQRDRAERRSKENIQAEAEQKKKDEDIAAKRDKSIKEFVTIYPGVDPKSIPQKVWDEVSRTGDLLGAYTRYENEELKAQIAAMKNNEKNSKRSTGSMKTAGSGSHKTPFDAGWDDI